MEVKRRDDGFRYRQRVQIVVAQPGDSDIVFAMAAALSLDGPLDRAAFNVQFDDVLRSERSVALLAIEGSAAVGYAVGALVPMPIYMGGAAFLQELFVDGSNRRGGVGTALVDAFTEWAARLGAARVVLATSRAGLFYESIGFSTRAQYYARAVTSAPKLDSSTSSCARPSCFDHRVRILSNAAAPIRTMSYPRSVTMSCF